MKSLAKQTANAIATIIVSPFGLLAWLEARLMPGSEGVHQTFAHFFALMPGSIGMYVRRAYYSLVLDNCQRNCVIGFGALLLHRRVTLEKGVYIGSYALIGSAHIGEGSLIGSRASLLSGGGLHTRVNGGWTAANLDNATQIKLGRQVWVGEGCILLADVGEGAMISSGAVVASPVKDNVQMAGNPARFVRTLGQNEGEAE